MYNLFYFGDYKAYPLWKLSQGSQKVLGSPTLNMGLCCCCFRNIDLCKVRCTCLPGKTLKALSDT